MGVLKERQFFAASIFFCFLSAFVGHICLRQYMTEDWNLMTFLFGLCIIILLILSIVCLDICHLHPADSHSIYTVLTQYLMFRITVFQGRIVYDSFLAKTADLDATQEEILLQEIIRPNVNTEFGQKYYFKDIKSRDDYRRMVPLMSYSDYIPYMTRIESNPEDVKGILTSAPVKFLAVTSGTTGKNKIIPITDYVKRKALFILTLTTYIVNALQSKLTLQRRIRLGYCPRVETSRSGLKKAPISFFLGRNPPFSLVPDEVYDIRDEQKALYIQAVIALSEPELGHIDGFMSNLVWSFWQIIEKNWRQMCDIIETGKLEEVEVDQYVKDAVEKSLKPNPTRANELRKLFFLGKHELAMKIWPSLDSVRMIKTGAFAHYTSMLCSMQMKGLKVLNPCHHGSEGIYGLDIWPSSQAHNTRYCSFIMMYTEFLPVQEQNEEVASNVHTLYPEQLEVGKLYEVVVSSPVGLYRYRMGDVIKVVDFFNQCPIYEFQYRTGHVLNCFWEKTPENVFYEALCEAMKRLNLILEDYTSTEDITLQGLPGYTSNSECKHYTLFLEFSRQDGSKGELSKEEKEMMDECLCEKMELYNTLRMKNSIGPLHVLEVRPGCFSGLRSHLLSHLNNQQTKMPRVIRSPELLKLLLGNTRSPS